MISNTLNSLSPIDGRYADKTADLRPFFSETALIKYRLLIEIKWFEYLGKNLKFFPLSAKDTEFLNDLIKNFTDQDALTIKNIEQKTRHDVKAVEYFLQEKISVQSELKKYISFLHFGCTSEDINNLAYALMIKEARATVLLPEMKSLIQLIRQLAHDYAEVAMLSKTHGQAATPTTLGKEMAVFVSRLEKQYKAFLNTEIMGKFNGATGNYNAHMAAYPEQDWEKINHDFVSSLGLNFNAYTTQIENHDFIAELMHTSIRLNTILIDFSRDIWSYISTGYFTQKLVTSDEVGSSTMPHKINPIDFENAEGNLGIAIALQDHFANKLPISRLQRDLSDSTVLRNLGTAFAHNLIAYRSLMQGIKKLDINPTKIQEDLAANWSVLAEAIQTVMRRYGLEDAYEQLKRLTQGKPINQQSLQAFIESSQLPMHEKLRLQKFTPVLYIGLAGKLAKRI